MAIVVPIVADTSGLVRSLTKGSTGLSKFGKVAAIAAGAAGIGALVATVRVGIGEFMEAERVAAQTNAVIKSTGGVSRVSAKQVSKLAESLMKKSGVDDEVIASGENMLLTFTRIRNEAGKGNDIFNQATKATLDLSVAMGKDMQSSAILVGKALNDPIKGVGALSKAGVQFTQAQKDQIKAMVESGDVMGAQKMILEELTTQFGGSAEAAGKTLPGQLNILKETFNNLAGELVSTFMPTITRAATRVVEFLTKFAQAPTLKAKVEVITEAIGDVWQRIKTWWTTGERKELPSGIKLTPPGSQQVDEFIRSIDASVKPKMRTLGNQLGVAFVNAIFGGAGGEVDKKGDGLTDKIGAAVDLWAVGFDWAIELVSGLVEGIGDEMERQQITIGDIFRKYIGALNPFEIAGSLGRKVADAVIEDVKKGPKAKSLILEKGLANIFTPAFKGAVKAARESLASGASSIASMLSESVSANFRVGGVGKNSAEIVAAQRKLADDRFDIEKERLEAELASSDDTRSAQLALDELLLQREIELRQRGVDDANAKNTQEINDLVAKFNAGKLSAEEFQASLTAIIGPDVGASLGGGFATAFDNQLQSVLQTAHDIYTEIGGALALAGEGSDLASVMRGENERRYREYLARWEALKSRREDIRDEAQDILDDDDSTQKQKENARNTIARMNKRLSQMQTNKKTRAMFGMALGGVLSKQVFTAGEAGPEAVMPLTGRGGVMLRDALGLNGKSQGATYNITVNAGMGTSGIDLGREIVAAIKQYERTNGNVFASA